MMTPDLNEDSNSNSNSSTNATSIAATVTTHCSRASKSLLTHQHSTNSSSADTACSSKSSENHQHHKHPQPHHTTGAASSGNALKRKTIDADETSASLSSSVDTALTAASAKQPHHTISTRNAAKGVEANTQIKKLMTNVVSSAQSTLPPQPISSSIITRSNKAANHQSASTTVIECSSSSSSSSSTTTTITTAKTRAQKARALATTSDASLKSQFENNANLEEKPKLALNTKKTPPQASLVCSPNKKKITNVKSSPDSSESRSSLSNSFNTSPNSSSSSSSSSGNNNNNLVALLPCSSQKLSSELLFSNVGQSDNDNCVALVNNNTSKSLTHYVNDQATENWLSTFKVMLIINLI
jgi:hypothetical protein